MAPLEHDPMEDFLNDEDFWNQVYIKTHRQITSTKNLNAYVVGDEKGRLRSKIYPRLDVEDVVHKAFIKIYNWAQNLQAKPNENTFERYTCVVAKRAMIDAIRQYKSKDAPCSTSLDQNIGPEESDSDASKYINKIMTEEAHVSSDQHHQMELIDQFIQEHLENKNFERDIQIWTLKQLQGFTSKEISETTGITESNTRTIVLKINTILKQWLASKGETL